MKRGRAYRRHQIRRCKARAYRVIRRWSDEEPSPKTVGRAAAVHCKFCSGSGCCGNLRTVFGPTRAERSASLEEQEELGAL